MSQVSLTFQPSTESITRPIGNINPGNGGQLQVAGAITNSATKGANAGTIHVYKTVDQGLYPGLTNAWSLMKTTRFTTDFSVTTANNSTIYYIPNSTEASLIFSLPVGSALLASCRVVGTYSASGVYQAGAYAFSQLLLKTTATQWTVVSDVGGRSQSQSTNFAANPPAINFAQYVDTVSGATVVSLSLASGINASIAWAGTIEYINPLS
jgi:hypothetical protein